MIVCVSHSEFYNHVIHFFMEVEGFPKDEKIKTFLMKYANKMLVKEQFDKCFQTMRELFYWTRDSSYHYMRGFHEVMLYDFLIYIASLQEKILDFEDRYFDPVGLEMITSLVKTDKEDMPEESLDLLQEYYFDVGGYEDGIFQDTDFLDIVTLCNDHTFKDDNLIKRLGINMDYYFDILPRDIRNRYKTGHCTLSGEISALVGFIKEEIEHRDLYKLFWHHKTSVGMSKMKFILDHIILFYFQKLEIDICWDILETDNSLTFIFYKKRDQDIKVMMKLIGIQNRILKEEMVNNMFSESGQFNNSFFVFLASNKEEKKCIIDFISNYIYKDHIRLYLNVTIFDYHKRSVPSKNKE
ncbi:MAG: hypothetical protein HFJ12_06160 [Bacilli bacterium]|nr:hypothetical protein [Bacilli bacterium]